MTGSSIYCPTSWWGGISFLPVDPDDSRYLLCRILLEKQKAKRGGNKNKGWSSSLGNIWQRATKQSSTFNFRCGGKSGTIFKCRSFSVAAQNLSFPPFHSHFTDEPLFFYAFLEDRNFLTVSFMSKSRNS